MTLKKNIRKSMTSNPKQRIYILCIFFKKAKSLSCSPFYSKRIQKRTEDGSLVRLSVDLTYWEPQLMLVWVHSKWKIREHLTQNLTLSSSRLNRTHSYGSSPIRSVGFSTARLSVTIFIIRIVHVCYWLSQWYEVCWSLHSPNLLSYPWHEALRCATADKNR